MLTFHRLHHATTSGGEKYAHMPGNALHCLEDACLNLGAAYLKGTAMLTPTVMLPSSTSSSNHVTHHDSPK